jgi:hypothetical protein
MISVIARCELAHSLARVRMLEAVPTERIINCRNSSDSRVVGIVTRDSILQVIQARNEVEVPTTA